MSVFDFVFDFDLDLECLSRTEVCFLFQIGSALAGEEDEVPSSSSGTLLPNVRVKAGVEAGRSPVPGGGALATSRISPVPGGGAAMSTGTSPVPGVGAAARSGPVPGDGAAVATGVSPVAGGEETSPVP